MLFLHWAANTLLQASAFHAFSFTLLIWLLLLLPFDFSVTSFCFRFLWQRQLSLFVLHFLLQGADRQAFFWQLRGRCTLLDFKFKFQEFNDKTNSQVQVFSDVVDWSKITCKWTNQIFQSLSRYFFWYLGHRTRGFISSKNSMK